MDIKVIELSPIPPARNDRYLILNEVFFDKIPDITGMTDNYSTYLLDNYMWSPVGTELKYSVIFTTDKRIDNEKPAKIVGSNELVIKGDYRNTEYDVIVKAVDMAYPQNPLTYKFHVQEDMAPYPKPIKSQYFVKDKCGIFCGCEDI
eukprot:534574-Hanusia_phi.AAC.3